MHIIEVMLNKQNKQQITIGTNIVRNQYCFTT